MDYKTAIYAHIRDTLLNAAAQLEAEGLRPIKKVAIYNRQYQEEDENAALPTPYALVEFVDLADGWSRHAGRKRGTQRLVVHLVQQHFSEVRSGSATEGRHLEVLRYPERIIQLLDESPVPGHDCLYHIDQSTDQEHKPYLVEKPVFQVSVWG